MFLQNLPKKTYNIRQQQNSRVEGTPKTQKWKKNSGIYMKIDRGMFVSANEFGFIEYVLNVIYELYKLQCIASMCT